MLRRRFASEFNKRFLALKSKILQLVVEEDALGLAPRNPFTFNFDPNQPRHPKGHPEGGQWKGSQSLSGQPGEDVGSEPKSRSDREIHHLGVKKVTEDEALAWNYHGGIRVLDQDGPEFERGGIKWREGGNCVLVTGEVTIHSGTAGEGVEAVRKLVCHELMHGSWEYVLQQYTWEQNNILAEPAPTKSGVKMRYDGAPYSEYLKEVPTYARFEKLLDRNKSKLAKDDGVTEYSKAYWRDYESGKVSFHIAVHETLAEIAALDQVLGHTTNVTKVWIDLYRAARDEYKVLRGEKKARSGPGSRITANQAKYVDHYLYLDDNLNPTTPAKASYLKYWRADGTYGWATRSSGITANTYDPNQPRVPKGQEGGGRWTNSITISPQIFLSLAVPFGHAGGREADLENVEELSKLDYWDNLLLTIKEVDGKLQVGLHDGRHRALAAIRKGLKTVTVDIVRGKKFARENPDVSDSQLTKRVLEEGLWSELGDQYVSFRDKSSGEITANTRWAFRSSTEKLDAFKQWLSAVVEADFLGEPSEDNWFTKYIQAGYDAGRRRAFESMNPESLAEDLPFYRGRRAEFLADSFLRPVSQERVNLLAARAYEDLKGVTTQMSLAMGRVLVDGMIRGDSPRAVARDLNAQVEGIGRKRALVIARTETVRAHNEGQLDALESMGVTHVGVAVEWTVSGIGTTIKGNPSPCKVCAPLAGMVLKTEEAHGLIPRHPNCMCSFIPANVGEKTDKQLRTRERIKKAITASLKAEKPKKRSLAEHRKQSKWPGATVKIAASRPKGIV